MDYIIFAAIVVGFYLFSSVWMKQLLKARNIDQKIILGRTPVIIGSILFCLLVGGWFFVKEAELDEIDKIRSPLEGLAPVFAKILEQEGHERIQLDTPSQDRQYQKMLNKMEDWMRLYPIAQSIYTIRKLPNGTNVLMLCPEADLNNNGKIDSELELAVPIGEVYPEYIAEMELALKGERTFQEDPVTDKWGTWISAYAPIYGSSGRVDGVLGIDFDYSKWKERIEHARLNHMYFVSVPLLLVLGAYWVGFQYRLNGYQVQENHQRYRRLLKQYRGLIDLSPDAILVHNGKILFVNGKAMQLLGADREDQVLGKDILAYIHPDDQELVLNRIDIIYETGVSQPLQEIKIISQDNQIRYVEVASIPIIYNDLPALQVIARDITEKKHMKAALQNSEERFRKIFEKAGFGIGLRKLSGEIIEINPELEKFMGYTREQLKHIPISWISMAVEPEEQLLEELISGKRESYQIEKIYFRPDGTQVCGILTLSLFPSEDQSEDYIIGMVVDVTEQKKIQKQLRDSEERYRTLVEYSPDAIVVHNGERILYVNPACVAILGASSRDELIGQLVMERIPPSQHTYSRERIELTLKESKTLGLREELFTRMDGTIIDVEVLSTPFVYEGKPALQTIFRDISEKKQAERELYKVQEQYRSVVKHIKEVIFQTDDAGCWTFLNPAWEETTGYSVAESIGTSFLGYVHPDDRENIQQLLQQLMEQKTAFCRNQMRYLTKEGGFRWIEAFARLTRDDQGNIIGISGTLNDITQRKEAEEELRRSEERFRLLTEYSSDLIALLDRTGKILYASPASQEIVQYEPEELVGKGIDSLIHSEDYKPVMRNLNEMNEDNKTTLTFRVRRKNDEYVWIESSIKLLHREDQQESQFIAVSRNITERKLAELKLQEANELLQRLSTVDGLTGIANRRAFDQKLNMEWSNSRRNFMPLSLIMMDIDFFKAYNDTYGHQGGDECLQKVAVAIQNTIQRNADLVCRYGGEEFAAILPETDEDGARFVAEKIRQVIEDLGIPHTGSKISPSVTLSLGIATMIPDGNRVPADLLAAADQALYQAKQSGRNQVVAYSQTSEA